MIDTHAGRVATDDQDIAEAVHEADMIAHVYERLVASLPLEFAQEMTRMWFTALTMPDEHACTDCDEEMV